MTAVPAPNVVLAREEWADDDFDIPDGHPIVASDAESDKDDDFAEDWDAEMNLGQTGGARIGLGLPAGIQTTSLTRGARSGFIPFAALAATVSAPNPQSASFSDDDAFDEDEGVSTIKLKSGPTIAASPRTPPRQLMALVTDDEDLESDFALPSDLSQLSLRPLEPHHPSKAILEWGDKDHSSYSSDAYSNLGLGIGASPSSFGTSTSQPETETEDDDDEGILDGLVVPAGLFETGKGGKELTRLLEIRKNMPVTDERVRIASPEEDDFELGLVFEDDVDLSPGRLLTTQKKQPAGTRPKSVPPRTSLPARPPSRLRNEVAQPARAQTTLEPSTRARNTRSPTFVRPRPPSRTSTPPVSLKRSEAYLSAASKPGNSRSQTSTSLRSQKSHGVLNPPSGAPRASLTRKASLSTLLDRASPDPVPSSSTVRGGHLAPPTLPKSTSSMNLSHAARFDSTTAASRPKVQHFQSSSRLHSPELQEFHVPPTRPSTPSSNPAALRLTMPTASSRAKARTPVNTVFSPITPVSMAGPSNPSYSGRASISPQPYARPPSASALDRSSVARSQLQANLQVARPLRKPKRTRQYGDGTELDKFEDLPTDRDKERKYRVAPKPVPSTRPPPTRSSPSHGTMGRRSGRESVTAHTQEPKTGTGTLRRQPVLKTTNSPTRRSRASNVTNLSSRKPTLIRNLGGSNAPKVVGDMKWNPQTLRWEGNEHVLRDFDSAVGSSTRPALITQLTGSSVGSPVGSFAGSARVVGNMIFDPTRMCWISRLAPEEEEPDVFADLADDEDEDAGRGGTIRALQPQSQGASGSLPQTPSYRMSVREQTPSPGASSRHSRAFSEMSDNEYLSSSPQRGGMGQQLIDSTYGAELRHRAEMKGWIPTAAPRPPSRQFTESEPDREHLWFIRAVATKNYEPSS